MENHKIKVFLKSKTSLFLSALLIFLSLCDCSPLELGNPCDPASKTYWEILFLKETLRDSTPYCGGVTNKTAVIFTNFQSADIVIGQPDFETKNSVLSGASLNQPGPVTVSGNQLYISDSRNHRILRYHQIPSLNGATADFVIGQTDFISTFVAIPPMTNYLSLMKDIIAF